MGALSEQVAEAAKQAAASARNTPTGDDHSTSQPSAEKSSASAAVELPSYLKGNIDEAAFAKLPTEQQEQMLKMGKSLYDDYQSKTKDFAPLRKFQKDLAENPKKTEFLSKALEAFDNGVDPFATKAEAKAAVSETKNLFADLKKHEDPSVREQAVVLESSILDMIRNEGASKAEMAELKRELKELKVGATEVRANSIREQLPKLGKAWSPIIEKYEQDIVDYHVKFPKISLDKILQLVTSPEEYRTAVLADGAKDKHTETERAKEHSTKPSAAVGGAQGVIKDEDIQKSRSRAHGDRVRWKGPISRLLPDILKQARNGAGL